MRREGGLNPTDARHAGIMPIYPAAMKRIMVISLLLSGCVYHWPQMEPKSRLGHEDVSIWESIGYGIASSALTVVAHEAGHATMGAILGADDIEVGFFGNGKIGYTRLGGDFSEDNLLFIDLAGIMMTYGLGELTEFLVLDDVIPERAQPFFATWTLLLKSDLYLQTAQSSFVESSDLAKFSEDSGFNKLGYLGFIGLDLLFHHETYVELFEEARTYKPAAPAEKP